MSVSVTWRWCQVRDPEEMCVWRVWWRGWSGTGDIKMGEAPAERDWLVLVAAREFVPIMRWMWDRASVAVRREVW